MKNLMVLTFWTLAFLFLSCNNNDDDNNGITVGGDGCTASWKVNGEEYSEDNLALCVYLDNTLNLSASTTGGEFQLQIDPITSTGTYVADPFDQDLFVYVQVRLSDGTQLVSNNVTVVVTEISASKSK